MTIKDYSILSSFSTLLSVRTGVLWKTRGEFRTR